MKYKKQVSFGYDRTGKRIRKYFQANTLAELNAKIDSFRLELSRLSNPSEVSFKEYSRQWLNTYKANRSKQTLEMYENALKKCEELDNYKVKRITRSMCQSVINDSWEFPSAARTLAMTLRQIFKTAIADGIIATNPADALSLPKKPNSRFYLLTEEDTEKIRTADLNPTDRLFTTILQVFGLRPAEALALQPTDFDFKNGVLKVTKALELANDNKSTIKSTKTGVSRDIPIPAELISPLRKRIRGKKAFYLFTKADGGLYTKSTYRRLCERIHKAVNEVVINEKLEELKQANKLTKTSEAQIRATDFFPDFTPYCFRHRRATDLYYLTQTGEISMKKAAELMGHSEIVFLKTYSHIDENMESKNIYKNFDFGSVKTL